METTVDYYPDMEDDSVNSFIEVKFINNENFTWRGSSIIQKTFLKTGQTEKVQTYQCGQIIDPSIVVHTFNIHRNPHIKDALLFYLEDATLLRTAKMREAKLHIQAANFKEAEKCFQVVVDDKSLGVLSRMRDHAQIMLSSRPKQNDVVLFKLRIDQENWRIGEVLDYQHVPVKDIHQASLFIPNV